MPWRDRRCPKNSNKKAEEHETEIPETDIGAAPAGRTGGLRHGQGGRCGRNGDFLVLLTDEGEYQTFEFGAGVDTGALEEGDCVSVTYTGELGKEDSTPTAVSISKQ